MAFDAILTEIVLDINLYTEKVPFSIHCYEWHVVHTVQSGVFRAHLAK